MATDIASLATYIAYGYKHIITDEREFVILCKSSLSLKFSLGLCSRIFWEFLRFQEKFLITLHPCGWKFFLGFGFLRFCSSFLLSADFSPGYIFEFEVSSCIFELLAVVFILNISCSLDYDQRLGQQQSKFTGGISFSRVSLCLYYTESCFMMDLSTCSDSVF